MRTSGFFLSGEIPPTPPSPSIISLHRDGRQEQSGKLPISGQANARQNEWRAGRAANSRVGRSGRPRPQPQDYQRRPKGRLLSTILQLLGTAAIWMAIAVLPPGLPVVLIGLLMRLWARRRRASAAPRLEEPPRDRAAP